MHKLINLLILFTLFGCREMNQPESITIETPAIQSDLSTDIPLPKEKLNTYQGNFYGKINSPEKPYTDRIPPIIKKLKLAINIQENKLIEAVMLLDGSQFELQGECLQTKTGFQIKLFDNKSSNYEINAQLDTLKNSVIGKLKYENAAHKKLSAPLNLSKKSMKYNPALPLPEDILGIPFRFLKEDKELETFEALTKGVLTKNASQQILNNSELEYLPQSDLEVLRNSIYARHGYAFKNKPMRYLFENKVDWYFPNSIQVERSFTNIEIKNIELIKRYEQHAEKYYDEFGR